VILDIYQQRVHSETRATPHQAWLADGWLPRTPDSLDALDLLLVMVATPGVVRRDGIRFEGLRYLDPLLAGYVGRSVTIRYDPRDITQIRVFLDNTFLCRAVSSEHPGTTISLKDVQAARTPHRRALRNKLASANRTLAEYLLRYAAPPPPLTRPAAITASASRASTPLRVYQEDLRQA
jgi:putative transposase